MSEAPGANRVLTEDEKQALAYHHKAIVQRATKAVAEAKADLKSAFDEAEKHGVAKADIKMLMEFDTAAGEIKQRQMVHRIITAARMSGSSVGSEFAQVEPPERPGVMRAAMEGKIAGYKNDPCECNETGDEREAWIRAWHEGQAARTSVLEFVAGTIEKQDAAKAARDAGQAPTGADSFATQMRRAEDAAGA